MSKASNRISTISFARATIQYYVTVTYVRKYLRVFLHRFLLRAFVVVIVDRWNAYGLLRTGP